MGLRRSDPLLPCARRAVGVMTLAVVALWLVLPGLASAGEARSIGVLDRCDPASFNAALGEGTCVMRNGGVSFDTFVERLNPKDGGHQAWRFAPEQRRLSGDQFLRVDNRGGEVHTFTEVEDFGAGFVPELNAALPPGTAPAVPIGPPRFIDPGDELELPVPAAGTHLFECLIHPWMRTTVAKS